MLQKIRRFTAVAAVSLALTSGLPAAAGPFSSLFVFGDSLVDTGNVFAATGGAVPPAPYANGRFSNGPVWVETLADGLGLTPDAAPVLLGGNNYAFGGARTGASGGVPGLLAQVGALWAPTHAMADPDALYVISAGSNDMRDARNNFPDTTPTDEDGRAAAAEAAIGNIYASLQGLAARGARHVLIANVADLGLTPESAQPGFPPLGFHRCKQPVQHATRRSRGAGRVRLRSGHQHPRYRRVPACSHQ